MLDFMNLKKNDITCSLCNEAVRNDNCSPKGCTHVFHSSCFESWTVNYGPSEEYTCPAPGCASKFYEIVVRKSPHGLATKVVSLKESHQCPICCEPVQTPVAMPESCNHTFCYVCLREWSRVRHECPLDRGTFELILLSETIGGPITKRVTPPPVQVLPEDQQEAIDTLCEICALPDDEEHLLLCDHCDRGYHTYCLPTPLSSIPSGDWFCPDCVRHGIGTSTSSETATRTRGGRSRRSRRTRIADREALESDRDEGMSSSFDDDDSEDESFRFTGELSAASQQRLTRRATRRHRGTRLLQDTISRLAARILSEVSEREQRRVRAQRRVRSRTAADGADTTTQNRTAQRSSSSQTVLVRNTDPGQPTTLGIARDTGSGTRSTRARNGSTGSQNETLSAARRRRLFVLSDSSSEEEENGIALNLPRLTNGLRRSRPHPLLESDGNNLEPESIATSCTADVPRPAKRMRILSTTIADSEQQHQNSALGESSTANATIQTSSEEANDDDDDDGDADSDYTPTSQPRSSVGTTSRPRLTVATKRRPKKQGRKRKRLLVKQRSGSSRTPKSAGRKRKVRRSRRTARLTLTQKKIKKKVIVSSKSTPVSVKKTSSHRSPLKTSGSVLPKLSILGAEPGYSLYAEGSSLDDFSSPTSSSPVTEPQPSTSTTVFRPAAPSLLRDIENGQASLFKFSTRHMNVNPDHSMSPIAVTKSTHPSSSTSHSGSMASTSTALPPRSSPSSTTSGYFSTPKPSSSTATIPRQNSIAPVPNTTASSKPDSTPTSPSLSTTSLQLSGSDKIKGWSVDKLTHAQSVLKEALNSHVLAGRIDNAAYLRIIDRAMTKIKQKDCVKVTDARIQKLATEYVDYMQRHGAT